MDGQTLKPMNSKLSWMLPAAGEKCLTIYLGSSKPNLRNEIYRLSWEKFCLMAQNQLLKTKVAISGENLSLLSIFNVPTALKFNLFCRGANYNGA
jgi:hypothetical protein